MRTRQNQFWRLLGAARRAALRTRLPGKQRCLLRTGSASGTSIASAGAAVRSMRPSSRPSPTIFRASARRAPQLQRICFNGQTAGKFRPLVPAAGLRNAVLPSTSPAYTLAFASKLAAWRAAIAANVTAA
jgi:G:T/U-mismatch repair DNA glycosylase